MLQMSISMGFYDPFTPLFFSIFAPGDKGV